MIELGLAAPTALGGWRAARRRRLGAWDFGLVAVPDGEFADRVALLQQSMAADDAWYAHFFLGDALVVAFRDAAEGAAAFFGLR